MWLYKLVLNSGEEFYYNELNEARYDKMQFCGTIFDRNGKEVF